MIEGTLETNDLLHRTQMYINEHYLERNASVFEVFCTHPADMFLGSLITLRRTTLPCVV